MARPKILRAGFKPALDGRLKLQTAESADSYFLARRRSKKSERRPPPTRAEEIGSGVVVVVPIAATLPVFPLLPMMSDAKKNPPELAIKFAIVTPVAEPTVNDSGPAGPLPPWQGGLSQCTKLVKLPNTEAEVPPTPAENPDVATLIVTALFTLNAKASPAPVPAKFSFADRVNRTDTVALLPDPLSVN